MELFDDLLLGFRVAVSLTNLAYCLLGTLVGTFVGVLPGIGPFVAIALLLPATYTLDPAPALIMLAGIYYGASYGGSTTAILVKLPGESASVVTCLDGYEMARQGRAGPALAIAALGSFFAGCVATLVIVLFAPVLVRIALKFGSAEYFSLMVLGLVSAVVLARGSVLKATATVFVGILLGIVGTDLNSSVPRLTFGIHALNDGLSFVVIAMGFFGVGEVLANLNQRLGQEQSVFAHKVGRLMLSLTDLRQSWKAVLRGTAIGSFFGVLPGAGPTISSFTSYTVEKRLAADPSRFGRGAIEGVAGPESANNAASQTAFIPTLTLGIPGSSTMVLILGALWVQGILPGPKLMVEKPDLFWGLIASMWIGNLMLLVLNLPLIGLWTRMLTIPYRLLYPAILLFICIGAYSLNNGSFEITLTVLFGVLGYAFILLRCEGAPLLLGFVLGPMLEENLRRTLILSRGNPAEFFTRPLSLGFLVAAAFLLIIVVAPAVRRKRQVMFVDSDRPAEATAPASSSGQGR